MHGKFDALTTMEKYVTLSSDARYRSPSPYKTGSVKAAQIYGIYLFYMKLTMKPGEGEPRVGYATRGFALGT